MIDYKEIEDSRRRACRAIAAVHDIKSIERIIPIGFPVWKSVWPVKVRIERTTGLVDRQLLAAIQKLGPASATDVAKWTGLPPNVVESSLGDLAKAGVALSSVNGVWSLCPGAEIEHFFVEQEHEFGFLSNGVTGNFLPTNQYDAIRSTFLVDDQIRKLRTICPDRTSAESEILKEIGSGESAHRLACYGIPDGFVAFADSRPRRERVSFVLAYLCVLSDGESEVVSATESAFRLDCPQQVATQYFERWRREDGREVVRLDGIQCADKGNERLVRVSREELWVTGAQDGEDDKQAARLIRQMIYPGWTCDHDGTFHRLLPGDAKTANHLALCRGCSLLRRSYGQIRDIRDMAKLAEEFEEECARDIPNLKRCPDFKEVLAEAAESSDGNVVEVAKRFLPQAPALKKESRSECRFVRSEGKLFGDVLIGAIDAAEYSILIMSPVLSEGAVFEALERARKRGVREICVITQLSEHRNNIFKTDPQFLSYELPRRKLAALGISVRDCAHTVHAKLVVVDSDWMFITSANLNANSLGVGNVPAVEVALEYRDGYVAGAGESLFREVWRGASYSQVRNDEHITIASVPRPREIRLQSCIQRRRGCMFLLSTPENQLLMRKMCELIAHAKKRVEMLSMSFYDLLEVPALFAEFKKALRRGVDMRVCVRPGLEMNFKPEQWPDPSTKALCAVGLKVYQRDHLHAKGLVSDGKQVLMMSANFNPYSLGDLQTSHIEMAVCGTTDNKSLAEFAKFVGEMCKD